MSKEQQESLDDDGPKASAGVSSLLDYNRRLRDRFEATKVEHRNEVRELREQIEALEEAMKPLRVAAAEAQKTVEESARVWTAERAQLEALAAKTQTEHAALVEALKAKLRLQMENNAKLSKELETTRQTLGGELEQLKAGLNKAESRGDSLDKLKNSMLEQVRGLKAELGALKQQHTETCRERDALAEEKAGMADIFERLEELDAENDELKAALDEQHQAVEKAREYNAQAEAREAENARLAALAEEKTEEAKRAVADKEKAEALAFESRSKLLATYAEQESNEILRTNLEDATEKLKRSQEQVAALTQEMEEATKRYQELEEKILFSSERESLRMSLASIVKKRKSSDA